MFYDHGKAQMDGCLAGDFTDAQKVRAGAAEGFMIISGCHLHSNLETGAYLRIYYQLLENWKVTIDQNTRSSPVVPITFAEASKNQHIRGGTRIRR